MKDGTVRMQIPGSAQSRKQGTAALLCQALLVFSPLLLMGALSLFLGKNAFASWPIWTDEQDYWRALYNWNAVGFQTGYSGLFEVIPAAGALSVHGVTPLLLYGWFVKLFGLSAHTIVICNAVWVSLGALVLCLLLKPRPKVSLPIALFTVTYVPMVLYTCTSMTQLFNYGLLMAYIALLLRFDRDRKPVFVILACLCVCFGCLYRINLFLLFLPLAWFLGGKRFSWRTWLWAIVGLVLAAGLYCLSASHTAPYVQGFLYHFIKAETPELAFRMLLSHTKANLIDYLTAYKVDEIQWHFRQLYMLTMGLCLIGSFFRISRNGSKHGPRFAWNAPCLWCFLWLAGSLGIVLMLYEVMDWADFRTLAPVLWLVPVCLYLRGQRLLPGAMLAGSLALLLALCNTPNVGFFADTNRFQPPEENADLSAAIACITYDPDATDPFDNTVRTDLSGERLLTQELAAGMGLETGWLTEDSVGKSRWIITDSLKMPLTGYDLVYEAHNAALFRRSQPTEAP